MRSIDCFSAPRSSYLHLETQQSISAKRRSTMQTSPENGRSRIAMSTPPIVSPREWAAAREQLLVKEKAVMRAHDALAAERRRMPWMGVAEADEVVGPQGN